MSFKIKFSDGRTISVSEIELHSLLAVGVVDSDTHIYKGETEEPVFSLDTESMGTKVHAPELRPIARRHDWLKGALIAFIITCGMMVLSNLHAAQVIGNLVNNPDYYQYPEEVGAFSDLHQGITALLYIVAYLFCIVLFACSSTGQCETSSKLVHPMRKCSLAGSSAGTSFPSLTCSCRFPE